ncbi:integral peroxisomal membrane peroxin-domain-containing protein [Umbelopsis sp. AD052]|nr:integral peroxisomal membrane peroxin-domain-containing protein [Umbelopsis sp. AD052]
MSSSNHHFEENTFANLTYCDYCSKLLWGLAKQGLECSECQYVCHNKCASSAPSCQSVKANPPARPNGGDSPTPKTPKSPTITDSPAANSLRQIQNADQQQQRGKSSKHKSTASVKSISSQSGFDSDSSLHDSHKDEVNKSPAASSAPESTADFTHHLKDVIMSSAVNASSEDIHAPAMLYLKSQPPLNAQTTTRNFTRFASKCGAIFAFRDAIIRLISWENTADTLLAMVVWCVICFYPVIVVFGPQLLLLRVIVAKFYLKYGKFDSGEPLTDEPESDEKMNVKSSATNSAQASPNQQRPSSKRTLSGFGLSSVLFASDDASPEYLSNLKNLQNMMGEFSDGYDLVMSNASHFDWSSETETMYLLQAILISMFVLAVGIWIIPWRLVFMFGGLSVFFYNTKFVQLVLRDIGPDLGRHSERLFKTLGVWYRSLEETAAEHGTFKEASLYENQRWWPGSGFTPQMLRMERGPWSDISGTIPLPTKYEYKPPAGYKWEDDDWTLDKTGPWKQNFLGVGKLFRLLMFKANNYSLIRFHDYFSFHPIVTI